MTYDMNKPRCEACGQRGKTVKQESGYIVCADKATCIQKEKQS